MVFYLSGLICLVFSLFTVVGKSLLKGAAHLEIFALGMRSFEGRHSFKGRHSFEEIWHIRSELVQYIHSLHHILQIRQIT